MTEPRTHDPQCDLFEEHSHKNMCICRYLRAAIQREAVKSSDIDALRASDD